MTRSAMLEPGSATGAGGFGAGATRVVGCFGAGSTIGAGIELAPFVAAASIWSIEIASATKRRGRMTTPGGGFGGPAFHLLIFFLLLWEPRWGGGVCFLGGGGERRGGGGGGGGVFRGGLLRARIEGRHCSALCDAARTEHRAEFGCGH